MQLFLSSIGDVRDEGDVGVRLFDLLDHALLVRQREDVVVGGRQVARPRVEHLNDLRAALDLVDGVRRERVGELREQRVQQVGRVVPAEQR